MSKAANSQPALAHIDPANSPLVEPASVSGGTELSPAEKALSNLAISKGLTEVINRNAEADTVRLAHKALVADSLADYWLTVDLQKSNTANGKSAADAIETATSNVSKALADAVLANALTRKEARGTMGQAFGFEPSKTTGKPTSKPMEPGNTIAKRVSSVTIAAEYALTGILPDKGGDSLPLVGQLTIADLLADYFGGFITVRAASERIEQAIKDARETVPLELNVNKLLSLAGKIETARDAIAEDESLKEAYGILMQVIASVPFKSDED